MAPSAYKNKKQPLALTIAKIWGKNQARNRRLRKGNQPLYPFLMFFLNSSHCQSGKFNVSLRFSTRPLAGLIEFAIFSMYLLL